jgi:hypothetical protein
MDALRRHRVHAALFVLGVLVYGGVAGSRLWRPSGAPHFVYQADAWLHGKASIDGPLTGDDWAKVEAVTLDDGREVSGRRLSTRQAFRTLGGEELPLARIKASRGATAYMSFPPLPTMVMLPSALISGRAGNDVLPTVLIAALILPLGFALLRRLVAAGMSTRTVGDDLWLVATLGFGTVLWFSAVQGKVWFTAHVIGVALAVTYAWASVEASRPLLAGLALGCAALTRTPMAFMFPLFALEALRVAGGRAAWRADRAKVVRALRRPLLTFAAPIALLAAAGVAYNLARFGAPAEFGHTFLDVRQQAQIEQFGLFNYHYLGRNLAVAFTLLPDLFGHAPWIQIGGHGLAIWVTTPLFVTLLWPRDRPPIYRALWLTVAAVAIPSLLYQNSGWVQFGYRFSLDYTVFLIALLAVGGRPLGRCAKALIVLGVVINLFGALTFDRSWQYYRVGGNAYDVVVAH